MLFQIPWEESKSGEKTIAKVSIPKHREGGKRQKIRVQKKKKKRQEGGPTRLL